MSTLIRFEVKKFNGSRLIGKQVLHSLDAGSKNPAPALWKAMWQDGDIEFLKKLTDSSDPAPDTVGWMGEFNPGARTFKYIAGVLTKPGTAVPEGFVYRDLPECHMGIGWIQGREEGADLYTGAHEHVARVMKENGYEYDSSAGGYEMECYSFERFTAPHYMREKVLIMDYYSPCKKIVKDNEDAPIERVINFEAGNEIRKSFESLAQRIVYAYKCTYPGFMPVETEEASENSQRQMHAFLHDVICNIYNNPSLIDLPEAPDDCLENWMLCNRKPELVDSMRKIERTLLEFYIYLYRLGELGEVRDNKLYISKDSLKIMKKRLVQLEQFGLSNESVKEYVVFSCEKYPELFTAWKLLYKNTIGIQRMDALRFLYCMYEASQYNARHFFGNISGKDALIVELENYFKGKGYGCSFTEHGISWDKEYPDKQRGHMGVSFDWKRRGQLNYSFHVPGFRLLLQHYDKMEDELKNLVFSRTKKCDGCGYCTQTDKTGKRKPLVIPLEYKGEAAGKCPLFPHLTWWSLEENVVTSLKKLYDFSEKMLCK